MSGRPRAAAGRNAQRRVKDLACPRFKRIRNTLSHYVLPLLTALVLAGVLFCYEAEAKQLRPIKDIETEEKVLNMYNKAVTFVKAKRHVHARILLEKAATFDQTSLSPYIHIGLADIYHELGNPERAIREAKISLKYDHNQKEVYYMLGVFCKDARRYDEAINFLNRYTTMVGGAKKESAEGLIENLTREREKLGQFSPTDPDYLAHLGAENGANQWPSNKIPLKVYIQPDSKARGFRPEFPEIARKAFITWYNASQKKLSFDFIDNAEMADIAVEWTEGPLRSGDEEHERMKAGLTTTERSSRDDKIKHARVQIRTVQAYSKQPEPEERIKATCLHEVGHSLGLNGHSTNPSDIMYFGNSSRQLPGLTHRDKATIARLYETYPPYPMVGVDTSFPYPPPDTTIPRLTNAASPVNRQTNRPSTWEQMADAESMSLDAGKSTSTGEDQPQSAGPELDETATAHSGADTQTAGPQNWPTRAIGSSPETGNGSWSQSAAPGNYPSSGPYANTPYQPAQTWPGAPSGQRPYNPSQPSAPYSGGALGGPGWNGGQPYGQVPAYQQAPPPQQTSPSAQINPLGQFAQEMFKQISGTGANAQASPQLESQTMGQNNQGTQFLNQMMNIFQPKPTEQQEDFGQ